MSAGKCRKGNTKMKTLEPDGFVQGKILLEGAKYRIKNKLLTSSAMYQKNLEKESKFIFKL